LLFLIREIRVIRGLLVQIINFEETDSGAAVLSGEDGSESAGWKRDIDACLRRGGRDGRVAAIVIES
jgi:hypothetical protein